MSVKVWVAVATSCSDCGGDQAVLVIAQEPTQKQLNDLELAIGGMWCIETRKAQVTIGELAELQTEEGR